MTKIAEKNDIFPLPLTLFEKYFLMDSSVEYPMLIKGRLTLTGDLNRKNFETAVQQALDSHPLFLKKIAKQCGYFYWTRDEEPFAVKWLDEPSSNVLSMFYHDIDEYYPMRMAVEKRDDHAIVHYFCHHARCDGMGLFRFWGDIFAAYAAAQGETVPDACPIELERIVERDRFQEKELPEKLSAFRIFWESLKGVVKWLRLRPLPLGEKKSEFLSDEPRFGEMSHLCPPESVEQLQQYAKLHDAKLNDLVMTLLFTAVAKWQRDRFASGENRIIRFNIPVNMRWDGCERSPAANIISYDFMTRTIHDCLSDLRPLLNGVHEEMQFFKDWQTTFIFLDALAFFNRIPGGLRRMVRSKTSLASLVYSNVGVLDRTFGREFRRSQDQKPLFGNMQLDDMRAYAPCRRMTHLTIVFATLANRMTLHCHYDREFISDEDMRLLLQYYDREQAKVTGDHP